MYKLHYVCVCVWGGEVCAWVCVCACAWGCVCAWGGGVCRIFVEELYVNRLELYPISLVSQDQGLSLVKSLVLCSQKS